MAKLTNTQVQELTALNAIKKIVAKVKEESGGQYQGFHSVYSGFFTYLQSEEFSKPALDKKAVIDLLNGMTGKGMIAQRAVKGGYLILLPEDVKGRKPEDKTNTAAKTFAQKYGL